MAALFTAYHLGCKAILALTESGSTALWMSRQKIHVPIFGLTSQIRSQRRMAMYRNVTPLLMPSFDDRDTALKHAEQLLVERGVLKPGDTYGITCGEPMGYPGGTNMLKVVRVPRRAHGGLPRAKEMDQVSGFAPFPRPSATWEARTRGSVSWAREVKASRRSAETLATTMPISKPRRGNDSYLCEAQVAAALLCAPPSDRR